MVEDRAGQAGAQQNEEDNRQRKDRELSDNGDVFRQRRICIGKGLAEFSDFPVQQASQQRGAACQTANR